MRISDWSADGCSSDLAGRGEGAGDVVDDLHARPPCVRQAGIAAFGDPACGIGGPSVAGRAARITAFLRECPMASARSARSPAAPPAVLPDRESVLVGNSVAARVELGGRRLIKEKK